MDALFRKQVIIKWSQSQERRWEIEFKLKGPINKDTKGILSTLF